MLRDTMIPPRLAAAQPAKTYHSHASTPCVLIYGDDAESAIRLAVTPPAAGLATTILSGALRVQNYDTGYLFLLAAHAVVRLYF